MKNEKKVEAKEIRFINGDKVCCTILPPLGYAQEPEVISAYGYDYIREDKIETRFAKELTQDIVDGAIETYNNIIETVQKIADDMKKQKEEKQELKAGDIVVLKSGGPIMTIIRFSKDGDAICNWYEQSEGFPYSQVSYPLCCLKEVKKEYYNECNNITNLTEEEIMSGVKNFLSKRMDKRCPSVFETFSAGINWYKELVK